MLTSTMINRHSEKYNDNVVQLGHELRQCHIEVIKSYVFWKTKSEAEEIYYKQPEVQSLQQQFYVAFNI